MDMLWAQIQLLLPSVGVHWVLLVLGASGAWYAWTRVYRATFKWQGPLIVATTTSLYLFANTVLGLYQNGVLFKYQQQAQAAAQQQSTTQASQTPVDPALQARADFLKTVESLIQNPNQINPENKKKVFDSFGGLFKEKGSKAEAQRAIAQVYDCQRYFWEDAVTAFKSKQVTKSQARQDCEKLSGNFFNRAKLIPDEIVKNNDETIAGFAARKRVPASDGKSTVEVSESMLKEALDAQVRASDAVKKIFE